MQVLHALCIVSIQHFLISFSFPSKVYVQGTSRPFPAMADHLVISYHISPPYFRKYKAVLETSLGMCPTISGDRPLVQQICQDDFTNMRHPDSQIHMVSLNTAVQVNNFPCQTSFTTN